MTYQNLKSYQQAVIIADLTVQFCKKYINPKSRTTDQMEQAARSGKQNIVEGCAASKGNPGTEIYLLNVARASFEELLEDYRDFLRQRGLGIWAKDDPRAIEMRQLAYRTDRTDETYKPHESYKPYKSHEPHEPHEPHQPHEPHEPYKSYKPYETYLNDPEKIANAMITLINQTNFLLDRQIAGVKRTNDKTGIIWESREARAARILHQSREANKKANKKFNDWLKSRQ